MLSSAIWGILAVVVAYLVGFLTAALAAAASRGDEHAE